MSGCIPIDPEHEYTSISGMLKLKKGDITTLSERVEGYFRHFPDSTSGIKLFYNYKNYLFSCRALTAEDYVQISGTLILLKSRLKEHRYIDDRSRTDALNELTFIEKRIEMKTLGEDFEESARTFAQKAAELFKNGDFEQAYKTADKAIQLVLRNDFAENVKNSALSELRLRIEKAQYPDNLNAAKILGRITSVPELDRILQRIEDAEKARKALLAKEEQEKKEEELRRQIQKETEQKKKFEDFKSAMKSEFQKLPFYYNPEDMKLSDLAVFSRHIPEFHKIIRDIEESSYKQMTEFKNLASAFAAAGNRKFGDAYEMLNRPVSELNNDFVQQIRAYCYIETLRDIDCSNVQDYAKVLSQFRNVSEGYDRICEALVKEFYRTGKEKWAELCGTYSKYASYPEEYGTSVIKRRYKQEMFEGRMEREGKIFNGREWSDRRDYVNIDDIWYKKEEVIERKYPFLLNPGKYYGKWFRACARVSRCEKQGNTVKILAEIIADKWTTGQLVFLELDQAAYHDTAWLFEIQGEKIAFYARVDPQRNDAELVKTFHTTPSLVSRYNTNVPLPKWFLEFPEFL